MANVHDGHRQRLKERFLRDGLDGFEAHNVLELLLFYAVPRCDTNVIAHELLKKFGSLSAVLDANFDDLCETNGVGSAAATLLKLIPDLSRRYLDDIDKKNVLLNSIEKIGEFLRPKFIGRTKEMIYLLCMDNKGCVLYGDFIAEGTIDTAPIYTRDILAVAIRSQATSIILAHNHPGGLAIPSNPDLIATDVVGKALEVANVKLEDHFIFAGSDFVSLRASGFFSFGKG